MLKIRKYSPKDLKQILEINRASFSLPWSRNEFEKYLENSFVAEENGKILGFVIGKIAGETGIVKLIAVDQNHRGKGVGESLMKHALKHFAENELKEVMARSRIHNKAGCAFLKSFGFEVIKTIENYYQDGEDAYLMEKEL